jgi:putative spermidine/putrescine transport system substrate-binding protein
MNRRKLAAAVAVVALVAAACSSGTPKASANLPTSVGAGEGRLDLVAWAGYVVGGTGGEKVEGYDWVSQFEQESGCKTYVKVGGSSDEMVTLMKTGQYDGVSASGDASLRLVAGGDVSPVNFDLIPNYKDVFSGLKGQSYNTVGGLGYGVPHGRGANLLAWRSDIVTPDPDSWGVVFDANSPYKGKVTAYDSPIYIADAAVYLKATKPELKITNPYALDDAQFKAAVDLLKVQRGAIGEYWSDATKQIQSFTSGTTVIGTTWQYQVNTMATATPAPPIKAIKPKEGATGWSDTWMIASKAKHPNCMYKWMDYILSPAANAAVTVYFGEAPVTAKACVEAEKLSPGHCTAFHAEDEAYFKDVYYWSTPQKDCGDSRGSVCKDYSEWTKAWTEIKG